MSLKKRYRRIVFFFGKILLNILFLDILFPKLGIKLFSKSRKSRWIQFAKQFTKMAIEMGGVMIKAGQFLSSRVDLLPPYITDVLAELQDEVPAETFDQIRKVAEMELGGDLEEVFSHFVTTPVAAASLGQAHQAELSDNLALKYGFKKVIVKILRPHIEEVIHIDIKALRTVSQWLALYPPISKRADTQALLNEFGKVLFEEIDYIHEGKNAEKFAKNFEDDIQVKVPKIVWELTTKRVLTLEDVTSIKITDYPKIEEQGLDKSAIANKLFQTYLKQIFEDGFVHADPHPGNLFVAPIEEQNNSISSPIQWQLTFIDFGMAVEVPPTTKKGLRELAIGIGTKNADRVVDAYQILGMLLPHANIDSIKQAESRVFEKFWGKSMTELRNISIEEMHEFAKEFRDIIFSMPFQVPSNLLYLARCVAILAGICTGLDPQFNVWQGLAPYANKLLQEDSENLLQSFLNEAENYLRTLLFLPIRLDNILTQVEQGKLKLFPTEPQKKKGAGRTVAFSIIIASFVFSGTLALYINQPLLGYILIIMAMIFSIKVLLRS